MQIKVLFVTTNNIHDINGGAKASLRNLECLRDIYGKENVETCYILQNIGHKTILKRSKSFIDRVITKKIFASFSKLQIQPDAYDLLFIDSSLFGYQIKKLKRSQYKGKIVSFFHNCEADYKAIFYKDGKTIGNRLYLNAIRKNEQLTIRHADACVFINERDMKRVSEIYGIQPKMGTVITMTMKDRYREYPLLKTDGNIPIYTILGSYFKPNVDGIKWFVTNVLPYVNIKLRVVGKNMHLLRNDIDCSGIEIFSNVPDLDLYMIESDYMLYPIFEGSGMKIKTCEALMWGKNIVGTSEAFSGYDITDYSKIGACCETAEEFIVAISTLRMPRFNGYSRGIYQENYSYSKSVDAYRQLLNSIGI